MAFTLRDRLCRHRRLGGGGGYRTTPGPGGRPKNWIRRLLTPPPLGAPLCCELVRQREGAAAPSTFPRESS